MTVTANSALLEWPADQYGFTSELRAALINAARGVRGNDEKLKIFSATMKVGMQHAMLKHEADKAALQKYIEDDLAATERRSAAGRNYGANVE